jgi:hypothetical protein
MTTSLLRAGRLELSRLVDLLTGGAPFRVRRGELPAGNTARRGGRADDLLMLVGDELRVA